MNNETLFEKIRLLVADERRIGTEILELLQEIEKRRAYFDLRYDGLFSYCVKDLGFTESQAYHRIQAMRAMNELPELKPLIEEGTLSVSAISKIQTHFRKEKNAGKRVTKAEKIELFLAVKGCTSKQVDKKISEVRGEPEKVKLFLEMDEELALLWEKAKSLAAHRSRGIPVEVFRVITKDWVDRHDPFVRHAFQKVFKDITFRNANSQNSFQSGLNSKNNHAESLANDEKCRIDSWSTWLDMPASKISPEHRHRPNAELRRTIWIRDEGKCTRCGSHHALEVDHIIPFACGGLTTEENLRLLCSSCNRTRAEKTFGQVRRAIH